MKQNKKINGDLYGQKYFEEHEFSYRDENREDIKRILELLGVKKSDRVLEIGCGLGVLLSKIPSKKKIGIEISDFAIKECQKKGLNVAKVNAEKELPFRDSSFDIVIMNEVISHLKNPEFVLRECYRILEPGGKIILTAPVRSLFFYNISTTHIHEMNTRELKTLLEESGFTILVHEVCGISFLYPLLENIFFKPFRFLRKVLGKKEKNGVRLIDSCHSFADKTILKPLGIYRKFLLNLGTNQLVLGEKKRKDKNEEN